MSLRGGRGNLLKFVLSRGGGRKTVFGLKQRDKDAMGLRVDCYKILQSCAAAVGLTGHFAGDKLLI